MLTRRAFVLGVAAPTLAALSGATPVRGAPRRPTDPPDVVIEDNDLVLVVRSDAVTCDRRMGCRATL
ncbi:hypothetical protein [Solirubrobacter soli]|uniref:hypothetical protein n=1 Tax=Solirubrobacter soli TaxID=363832 RepID=UPI00041CC19C|nr:hypothetical protein [Solirubrobacter soli]